MEVKGGRRRKGSYCFGSPHNVATEPFTRFNVFSSVISSSAPSTGPVWVEQMTSILSNPLQRGTSPREGPSQLQHPEAAQTWRLRRDFLPQKAVTSCKAAAPGVQGMGDPSIVPRVELQGEKCAWGFPSPWEGAPKAWCAAGQAGLRGKAHQTGRIGCHQLRRKCPQSHWQKESTRGSEIGFKL